MALAAQAVVEVVVDQCRPTRRQARCPQKVVAGCREQNMELHSHLVAEQNPSGHYREERLTSKRQGAIAKVQRDDVVRGQRLVGRPIGIPPAHQVDPLDASVHGQRGLLQARHRSTVGTFPGEETPSANRRADQPKVR